MCCCKGRDKQNNNNNNNNETDDDSGIPSLNNNFNKIKINMLIRIIFRR
jgi:hypothetical protein